MESVLEADDRRTSRVSSRDFDGILNGFGAAIQQYRFFGKVPGHERVQFLRQFHIFFVGSDAETGMDKFVQLFANCSDDSRRTVPDVQHADAACEIEEPISINIFENGALGARCEYRSRMGNTARNGGFPSLH